MRSCPAVGGQAVPTGCGAAPADVQALPNVSSSPKLQRPRTGLTTYAPAHHHGCAATTAPRCTSAPARSRVTRPCATPDRACRSPPVLGRAGADDFRDAHAELLVDDDDFAASDE